MNGAVPLAFIPWFLLPSLSLGPITIQSFGVLSALGILLATVLTSRAARELGKDPQVPVDFAVAGVLAGVVGGHLVHLLAYHPEELHEPWRIFMLWEGLSSMGGLLGGVVAAVIWFRVKRVRFSDYADAFALGIAPGWGVARIGCFTVHDHPGVLTSFPLAVRFPDGPRHDLGLYEAILLLSLGAVLWVLHRRGALRGRSCPWSRWSTASGGSSSTSSGRGTSSTPTRATSASPSRSTRRSCSSPGGPPAWSGSAGAASPPPHPDDRTSGCAPSCPRAGPRPTRSPPPRRGSARPSRR